MVLSKFKINTNCVYVNLYLGNTYIVYKLCIETVIEIYVVLLNSKSVQNKLDMNRKEFLISNMD